MTTPLDPATQARVIADSVDLRNPDWRTCLAVDVAAALGGTRIDPLPDGHEAAVPAGAPGDRDHTPCVAECPETPGHRRRECASDVRSRPVPHSGCGPVAPTARRG